MAKQSADPLVPTSNDIEDAEGRLPGLIRATNERSRHGLYALHSTIHRNLYLATIYKIPVGKSENRFAFSDEAENMKCVMEIIHETHEAWRRLINGNTPPGDISMWVPPNAWISNLLILLSAPTSVSWIYLEE